jgi:hypothetical protein
MKSLGKKLVLAMKAIDAVEKSGKNEKQGYKYVKATDVAREVRGALAAQGIAFGYSVTKMDRWTQPTLSGGTMNFVELWADVTFSDSESDESVTYGGVGWGMDTGDKGPYKAMTGLLKYALRMNFMIPDESDPESDSTESPATNGSGKEIVRKSQKVPVGMHDVPIFDEDGNEIGFESVVQMEPAPTQLTQQLQASINKAPAKFVSGKTISEKQAARFWAIAKGSGKTKPQINDYLGKLGIEAVDDMPWKNYDQAIQWLQEA